MCDFLHWQSKFFYHNRIQKIQYDIGYYEGETKDSLPNGKGQLTFI